MDWKMGGEPMQAFEFSAAMSGKKLSSDALAWDGGPDGFMAALADGSDGFGNGRQAAQRALSSVWSWARGFSKAPLGQEAWENAFLQAEMDMVRQGELADCSLLCLWSDGEKNGCCSVGDCQAWALVCGQWEQVNQDHPKKPRIGSQAPMAGYVEFGRFEILAAGTDGLFLALEAAEVLEMARHAQDPAAALEARLAAKYPGGLPDDASFWCLRRKPLGEAFAGGGQG